MESGMTPWFNAHTPERRPPQEPPPGKVLPGQPVEDPIPPEMAPDQDMPELPHPPPERG
jgi:hypothetical protein